MNETFFIAKGYIPEDEFRKIQDATFMNFEAEETYPFTIYASNKDDLILTLFDKNDEWYLPGIRNLERDCPVLSAIFYHVTNKGCNILGLVDFNAYKKDDGVLEDKFTFTGYY